MGEFTKIASGLYLEGLAVDHVRDVIWYSDVIAGGIHGVKPDGTKVGAFNESRMWTGGVMMNADGAVLSTGEGGIMWNHPDTGKSGWLIDRLDGELVVLDGKGWQIRGDGGVRPVPPDMKIPFAMVTPFEADGEGPAPPAVSLEALDDELDERFPQRNNFVAFRIDADLSTIRLRSVRGQSKPYRPLAEAAGSQAEWSLDDVRGTLVGIRSPAWTRGAAVPGHHWHFLSADRRAGGHVLDCRIRSGTLRHDVCGDWTVKLEQSPEFDRFDLDRDLRREVRQVESMREAAGK